jgi:hypothetical protein
MVRCQSFAPVTKGKGEERRWTGHAARTRKMSNAYTVFVGKPEGKRPLGKPRHRWKDNIKIYHKETRCGLDPPDSG